MLLNSPPCCLFAFQGTPCGLCCSPPWVPTPPCVLSADLQLQCHECWQPVHHHASWQADGERPTTRPSVTWASHVRTGPSSFPGHRSSRSPQLGPSTLPDPLTSSSPPFTLLQLTRTSHWLGLPPSPTGKACSPLLQWGNLYPPFEKCF